MILLILTSLALYQAGAAFEICHFIFPGASCQSECATGFSSKAVGFPYCLSGKTFCCEPPPTTPPPPTTTVTTQPPPPPTSQAQERVCGFDAVSVGPRVIVGDDVPANLNDFSCAWPWMVSVMVDIGLGSYRHICTGVLVSKDKFLTSKSCVNRLTEADLSPVVSYGKCNVTNLPLDAPVSEFTIEKTYPNEDGDIALAKLTKPVEEFNVRVLPTCLPDYRTVFRGLMDEKRCYMVGRSQGDGVIGLGKVTILERFMCKLFNKNKDLPVGTFCTAVPIDSVDACDGSEGGMVMCPDTENRWVLKGIIQDGTCLGRKPGSNRILDMESLSNQLINDIFGK